MRLRGGRSIVCGLLSLAIAGVLLLPPEHVHVEDVADGHQASVIHRHFAPHQAPGRRTSLDHPDHDPQWLSSVLAGPQSPARVLLHDQIGQQAPVQATPKLRTGFGAIPATEASTHDPPLVGSHALRGPPTFLL